MSKKEEARKMRILMEAAEETNKEHFKTLGWWGKVKYIIRKRKWK